MSSAGGLGWGFGASLGAKLASPDRMVLSVLGDGAYMFANPTACHYVAQMQKLPVLTVIYNNALYGAVRRATLDMFGSGSPRKATVVCWPICRRRASKRSSRRMMAMANASNVRPICRRRCVVPRMR